MSDPVTMEKSELEAMKNDMKKVVEANDGLKKELDVTRRERDQARSATLRAKEEVERLQKLGPEKKTLDENKGLRTSVSEAHKKIAALEKELAAIKIESEDRRKEVSQLQQKLSNVQNTMDMMQSARNKAQVDRDKALVDLQTSADAYGKLREEFEAFKKAVAEKAVEGKNPKAQPKPEPAKA